MLSKEISDIIEGLRAGEHVRRRNESRLFDHFKDLIRTGTYKYKLSQQDATAAYNESIRCVIANIDAGKFEPGVSSSLEAYTATIFRNKCIDMIRSGLQRSEPIEESLLCRLPEQISHMVEHIIDARQLRMKIDACYKKMGEPCRKLLMHAEEGFRDKEIAEMMAYHTADVAKQTRLKCRKRLAECLNLSTDG